MTAISFEELPEGVGMLSLDLPGSRVNTLSAAVMAELAGAVGALDSRTDLRGLLVRSGKPGQFIAGADLHELAGLATAPRSRVEEALRAGHELFRRLERLPFPTVALVDGGCMGGGTELVLALDERLLSTAAHTGLALPEVRLGVIPAWGGTQRLPRLVGFHHAATMILSGDTVAAAAAVAMGLAFDAVPPERLVEEGVRLLGILREDGAWRRRRAAREGPVPVSPDELAFTAAVTRGGVAARTKGFSPAASAAVDAIFGGGARPLDEALAVERAAALELVGSPVASSLIGLFFARTRLARESGVDDPAVVPRDVRGAGVVGAGQMGAGIAAAFARSGFPTTLVDRGPDEVAAGLRRAMQVVEGRIAIGRATPAHLAEMLARINSGASLDLLAGCDLAVEAVTESEPVKEEIHARLADRLGPDAIIATNTSTISVTRLAGRLPRPERFVGMHFFHPVDRMELVEVIRGERTDDATVATTVAVARRLRKTPIVVRDCPGFLVNRLLFPYLREALSLLVEGSTADAIDAAATRFGMPMGPIALQDLVGLDTAALAGRVLAAAYPGRAAAPPVVEALVARGRLGQKSAAGFRRFAGRPGRAENDPALDAVLDEIRPAGDGLRSAPEPEIVDRLFLPMLLEAARVLEEGIVRQPVEVDMGLVLGLGFPPFRGGILRWCDAEGIGRVRERVERLRHLGPRFEPCGLFEEMAREGRRFHVAGDGSPRCLPP